MTPQQVKEITARVEAADQSTVKEVISDDDANLGDKEYDFILHASQDIWDLLDALEEAQKHIELQKRVLNLVKETQPKSEGALYDLGWDLEAIDTLTAIKPPKKALLWMCSTCLSFPNPKLVGLDSLEDLDPPTVSCPRCNENIWKKVS